ncbi:MAG: serine hydrolase [Firmicutes bacterium]|nr:serine hydrolase [Bacillota bacterium]
MTSTSGFKSATPEDVGIPSSAIRAFLRAVNHQSLELHSFILLRHGQVAAEGSWAPYSAARCHKLFSLSKSFTSTAVGFAVSEGLLSVEDLVLPFFPADAPDTPDPNLTRMRIKDLLTMTTGHAADVSGPMRQAGGDNWVRGFLSLPVEHAPGTHFVYNNGATYMLSAIVTQVTGETVLDYLTPRLFAPLGIENPTWSVCPRGITLGFSELKIGVGDIARFGQLYLQGGVWEGKQVIPADWVQTATSRQVRNEDNGSFDWSQGYGYQFWMCREGAYRGDGAFGQYCIVMPEQAAVLAITSGVDNMQAVLDLVWAHLLPNLGKEVLLPNNADYNALQSELSSLSWAAPASHAQPSATVKSAIPGQWAVADASPQGIHAIALTQDGDTLIFQVRDPAGDHQIVCEPGGWSIGKSSLFAPDTAVAASYAWEDEATCLLTIRALETPFCHRFRLQFAGDDLTIQASVNVAFGPTTRPPLRARRLQS